MTWSSPVASEKEFFDFLSYCVVYAPDFPNRSFLSPEEQLTWDRAFLRLRDGLQLVRKYSSDPNTRTSADELVRQADSDIRSGTRTKAGVHTLQRLEELLTN